MANRILTNNATGQHHDLDELLEMARQKEELDYIQLEALIVGMQKFREKAIGYGGIWRFELLSLHEGEAPRPDMSRIYFNGKQVEVLNFSLGMEQSGNSSFNVVHLTVPMRDFVIDKRIVPSTFMAHRDIMELSKEFGIDLAHYVKIGSPDDGGDDGSDRAST